MSEFHNQAYEFVQNALAVEENSSSLPVVTLIPGVTVQYRDGTWRYVYGPGLTVESWEILYRQEFDRLIRFAIKRFQLRYDEAEEVVQQAFYELYLRLARYADCRKPYSVIFRFIQVCVAKLRADFWQDQSLEEMVPHVLESTLAKRVSFWQVSDEPPMAILSEDQEAILAMVRDRAPAATILKALEHRGYPVEWAGTLRYRKKQEALREQGAVCRECGRTAREAAMWSKTLCWRCGQQRQYQKHREQQWVCRECERVGQPMRRRDLCKQCYYRLRSAGRLTLIRRVGKGELFVCQRCGAQGVKCEGHGLCSKCYEKDRSQRRQYKPPKLVCCVECHETRRHGARGMCVNCAQRERARKKREAMQGHTDQVMALS
jgi:DNA-directed RNA polymerase specialized sigma24 family protein